MVLSVGKVAPSAVVLAFVGYCVWPSVSELASGPRPPKPPAKVPELAATLFAPKLPPPPTRESVGREGRGGAGRCQGSSEPARRDGGRFPRGQGGRRSARQFQARSHVYLGRSAAGDHQRPTVRPPGKAAGRGLRDAAVQDRRRVSGESAAGSRGNDRGVEVFGRHLPAPVSFVPRVRCGRQVGRRRGAPRATDSPAASTAEKSAAKSAANNQPSKSGK